MVLNLHCGDAAQGAEMSEQLVAAGFRVDPAAPLSVVLDEPLGWASLSRDRGPGQTVIISRNHCPAYRLDLLEGGPAALVYPKNIQAIVSTLNLVAEGETVHPTVHTPLTPAERYTVRYTARGHTNKEIAKVRNISEGRIKNILSVVYGKLNLKSRVQIAHYYYGNWHLLPGWTPPEHVDRTELSVS